MLAFGLAVDSTSHERTKADETLVADNRTETEQESIILNNGPYS